jgi:hypothetical protein
MKFVVMLIGMAILAWIIATQLNTAKVIAGHDGVQGTPQQIYEQTKERTEKISADMAKRAEQSDPAKLPGAVPSSVPADEP